MKLEDYNDLLYDAIGSIWKSSLRLYTTQPKALDCFYPVKLLGLLMEYKGFLYDWS